MTRTSDLPVVGAPAAPEWTPTRVADLLNERFVFLARILGKATALGRVWRRGGASRRPSAKSAANRHAALVKRAEVRLSELHIQIGETLYGDVARGADREELTRQLCALLEEVDRLEEVLRRMSLGVAEPSPSVTDTDATRRAPRETAAPEAAVESGS